MKLFNRYSQVNILSTVAIFLLASIAFYFLLSHVLTAQVDEDLEIEQHEIEQYLSKYGKLPDAIVMKDQQVTYKPVQDQRVERRMLVTIPANRNHHEDQRQLNFPILVKEQWFEVQIIKSLEGTNELTRSVALISLATILMMLIATIVINRILLRSLWKPFYSSLELMRVFKLGSSAKPEFGHTNIEEFVNLNNVLADSIQNAETEYRRLKDFTENAAHELQTPLAVVRSKLDVLIQDEALSEQQSNLVQSMYAAVQRMTKLNHTLLLLSKIENNQFNETTLVQMDQLVERKLQEFSELLLDRKFIIEKDLSPVQVNMNSELAELMLNNLFSNVIRHTDEKQNVRVRLHAKYFSLSNTASNGSLEKERLFDRFYKGKQHSDQNGLGLSIISQIAQVSGFQSRYQFLENEHVFSIIF